MAGGSRGGGEESSRSLSDAGTLSLWDAISIIVGIVVGVSIFKVPPIVFSNTADPLLGLGAWLLGGLLALVGALCYAELATAYPRSGGDYVYLTLAYGRWMGFLFGWTQLAVILTGSIGSLAYVFADYTAGLLDFPAGSNVWVATAAVLVLTGVNFLGLRTGKTVQNLLTVAKLAGLAGLMLAGLALAGGGQSLRPERPVTGPGFGLAMVMVLYAYGGWNDSAFVAAEVRNRSRNMPLALIIGTVAITVLYLLVNGAYLAALGFEPLRDSETPAAEVLRAALGPPGAVAMSLLVMAASLGAVNALILTGSRVYSSLGEDHRLFARLSRWHPRWKSPIWSLAAQAAVSVLLILVVGTALGRSAFDAGLRTLRLQPLAWEQYEGGFDMLIAGTAPAFWFFFLSTGLSVFVLRFRDPQRQRPFAVPWYPLIPAAFCLMSLYMLYASIVHAKALSLLGIVPLLLGLPLYWISRRLSGRES